MARLLDVIAASRKRSGSKAFSEPPFWSQAEQLFVGSTPREERIETSFEGLVSGALKSSGPVFGCIMRRAQVFSQGRFQWTRYTDGIPSDPFGSSSLALLEQPWPHGTTGELLTRLEFDASLAGNAYWTTTDDTGGLGDAASGPGRRMVRLRPDWSTLVIDAPSGNPYGPDARVVALRYDVPIRLGQYEVRSWILLPSEFVHYSPIPDPVARYRGMSWLTPILSEVEADLAATKHKGKVFANGAMFARAIKFDKDVEPDAFERFMTRYNAAHRGPEQAYKTLFLTPGADLVPMSMDFQQLDYKVTQGAGETRVCVAAGVPAAIAGVSEGLAGSSLNAGNLGVERRLFVDTTIRDLWNKAAPSLQPLVSLPRPGAELMVDDRHIPFLREDAKDRADTAAIEATIIANLTREGFKAETVIAAVRNHDWKLLVHMGLLSVQLHDPTGTAVPAPNPMMMMPPLNGANGASNGSQATVPR